ncbi:MAG: tetratricopeptide repeat protein [Acidimicrobiales bacterium]
MAMTGDRQDVILALERQLSDTPRSSRPHEHATVAYRLGLAYAEAPGASPADGLRKALACYDVAAAIFDPRFEPVHHARVLNAAGAAQRGLGDRKKAAELFEKSAALLTDGSDSERAAVLNNLGLARTELGQASEAVDAFDQAAELFDSDTPESRRGLIATLVNRGQAHTAMGTDEALEAALADFEQARAEVDPDEAPYHQGLVEHSVGVACSALAVRRPDERESFLSEAATAFSASLQVFSRSAFPFQYAMAKHNLGLAYAGLGGERNLRRALACFEDALGVFDTRVHGDAWRQAFSSLERVEEQLAEDFPGAARSDHFAALLAQTSTEEATALLKERLFRHLSSPEPRRTTGLAELALAVGKLPEADAKDILEAELLIVMEQDRESHEVTLRAIHQAHSQIEGEQRTSANRALDQSIGGLGGVQRIHVRDFLYSIGWERP